MTDFQPIFLGNGEFGFISEVNGIRSEYYPSPEGTARVKMTGANLDLTLNIENGSIVDIHATNLDGAHLHMVGKAVGYSADPDGGITFASQGEALSYSSDVLEKHGVNPRAISETLHNLNELTVEWKGQPYIYTAESYTAPLLNEVQIAELYSRSTIAESKGIWLTSPNDYIEGILRGGSGEIDIETTRQAEIHYSLRGADKVTIDDYIEKVDKEVALQYEADRQLLPSLTEEDLTELFGPAGTRDEDMVAYYTQKRQELVDKFDIIAEQQAKGNYVLRGADEATIQSFVEGPDKKRAALDALYKRPSSVPDEATLTELFGPEGLREEEKVAFYLEEHQKMLNNITPQDIEMARQNRDADDAQRRIELESEQAKKGNFTPASQQEELQRISTEIYDGPPPKGSVGIVAPIPDFSPAIKGAIGATGMGLSTVGLIDAVQSGDTPQAVMYGVDMGLNGAGITLDALEAAGRAVPAGLTQALAQVNLVTNIAIGTVQIAMEDQEYKPARAATVWATLGAGMGAQSALAAAGIAGAGLVVLPAAAAIGVSVAGNMLIENSKHYDELDRYFQYSTEYANIRQVTLNLKEEIEAKGVTYTEAGQIDFTNTENLAKIREAIVERRVEAEKVEAENGSVIPRWARTDLGAPIQQSAKMEQQQLDFAIQELYAFQILLEQYQQQNLAAAQQAVDSAGLNNGSVVPEPCVPEMPVASIGGLVTKDDFMGKSR